MILDQSFISSDEKCLISLVKGLQDQFIIPPCQALRYIYKNGGCMLWFPLYIRGVGGLSEIFIFQSRVAAQTCGIQNNLQVISCVN